MKSLFYAFLLLLFTTQLFCGEKYQAPGTQKARRAIEKNKKEKLQRNLKKFLTFLEDATLERNEYLKNGEPMDALR